MGAITQPRLFAPPRRPEPRLQLVVTRRPPARLHLLTYTIGTALFWLLWAAISISADTWYWWAVVPIVGWMLVLGLYLAHAKDRSR